MARAYLPSDPRERRFDVGLWLLALACASVTLFFSFGSYVPGAELFAGADKFEHSIAYGATLLCFMFAADWRPRRGDGPFPRAAVPMAILAMLLGIVVEWLQGRYFHRDAEILDAVADAVGALGALGLFMLVRGWLTRRPTRADSSYEVRA
jgi:hypothetical protein